MSGYDLYQSGDMQLGWDAGVAAALSFVTAMVAIWGLMRWLRHAGFGPFVLYRILLAGGLLYWVYA